MDEIINEEEGLFDDYVPEETTEETIEEPTESNETVEETATEETTEEPVENTVEPYGLKIKFNGEEKTLTEEEARTFAQKGMNYDRFYEPIERLARMNNMSVGDYVNQLNDTQVQYEVSKEMDSLREDPKYANVDEEVLEEIASAHVKEMMGERDRTYETQVKEQTDAQQLAAQKQIDMFMEEYPEYRDKGPEALDPKVFDYVHKGYTLLEAYNKFQRDLSNSAQSEAKAKASQLNEANKKKALGNTTNAGNTDTDAFLSGLNS